MINATILKNGNLKLTANNEARKALKEAGDYWSQFRFIQDELHEKFDLRNANEFGHLSESPILTKDENVFYEDNGDLTLCDNSEQWYFDNYMLQDFQELLKNKGYVIFNIV